MLFIEHYKRTCRPMLPRVMLILHTRKSVAKYIINLTVSLIMKKNQLSFQNCEVGVVLERLDELTSQQELDQEMQGMALGSD